ncbi:hypothetical protein MRB53_040243 [Persea americana]|nr:hypothetical protein MRB53_040243 [Persea americana]
MLESSFDSNLADDRANLGARTAMGRVAILMERPGSSFGCIAASLRASKLRMLLSDSKLPRRAVDSDRRFPRVQGLAKPGANPETSIQFSLALSILAATEKSRRESLLIIAGCVMGAAVDGLTQADRSWRRGLRLELWPTRKKGPQKAAACECVQLTEAGSGRGRRDTLLTASSRTASKPHHLQITPQGDFGAGVCLASQPLLMPSRLSGGGTREDLGGGVLYRVGLPSSWIRPRDRWKNKSRARRL